MSNLNIEAFLNAWLSYEEIESIKIGINDINKWNIVSFEEVKAKARTKLFTNSKSYA